MKQITINISDENYSFLQETAGDLDPIEKVATVMFEHGLVIFGVKPLCKEDDLVEKINLTLEWKANLEHDVESLIRELARRINIDIDY